MKYHYLHPEYFKDWIKPEFKSSEGNLILWGAGKIGAITTYSLLKQGLKPTAFCDISMEKWGNLYLGYPIISPDELKRDYKDATVLISTVYYDSVYPELIKKGFKKIFDCTSLLIDIDFDADYNLWMKPEYAIRNVEQYLAAVLEQHDNSHIIDQIFLHTTTHCTLRCKNCSSFIPYVQNPCHFSSEHIIMDFFEVLEAVNHIRVVNFYGGEPLLHPDLAKMMQQLHSVENIDRITIITNGTLLPDEKLIASMKQEKRFVMRISDYGVVSNKIESLKALLQENQIPYELTNYSCWYENSRIGLLHSSEEELINKFQYCTAYNAMEIINRKLYLCSTCSVVSNIGGFPDCKDNYVDLSKNYYTPAGLKQKIAQYMNRRKTGEYLDACRYCSGSPCTRFEFEVPVAEQVIGTLTISSLDKEE